MIKVNLLRPERKEVAGGEKVLSYADEEQARGIKPPAVIAGLSIGLVLILLLYILQDRKLKDLIKSEQEKNLRLTELQTVIKELEELERVKNAIDNQIKVITDLKMRQKNAVLAMDKISRCLPDWLWLTSLSVSNNVVSIGGKAMSNSQISDFVFNMKNSTYFTNFSGVTSQRSEEGNQEVYTFKFTCQFIRPPETVDKVV